MIKVERSYPAPESLAIEAEKANGSYNLPDVTARLRKDFFDKCYICGIKPMPDAQVEHRLPHKTTLFPEENMTGIICSGAVFTAIM